MQTTDKTVTIYTDSLITLDSLRNGIIHTFLMEEIWEATKLDDSEKHEYSTTMG